MKKGGFNVAADVEAIKAILKSKGLSARQLPLARNVIKNCQKGQKTSEVTALALAEALQTDVDNLFPGFSDLEAAKESARAVRAFITLAEREEYAVKYMNDVRNVCGHCAKWFDDGFEEAFSIGLVAFAEALNSMHADTFNPKTYIQRVVKNRLIDAFKRTRASTRVCPAGLVYLDAPISAENEGTFADLYPSPYNTEDQVILRDELRRAVADLSEHKRRDKYIQGLVLICFPEMAAAYA